MLLQGIWGNRWWVRCRVVPYMGMEFGGFYKRSKGGIFWGLERGGEERDVCFCNCYR